MNTYRVTYTQNAAFKYTIVKADDIPGALNRFVELMKISENLIIRIDLI